MVQTNCCRCFYNTWTLLRATHSHRRSLVLRYSRSPTTTTRCRPSDYLFISSYFLETLTSLTLVDVAVVVLCPTRSERGNKRCFCLSVEYIANTSRTQKPNVPKFGVKAPHLRCDLHTSLKVKRSKFKVTRPINADTRRSPYLPNVNLLHTAGCCCLAYL